MKTIITMGLALVIILSNCITVWAADIWRGNNVDGETYTIGEGAPDSADSTTGVNKATKNVSGKFQKESNKTYSVIISWGALKYTYNGKVKWNGTNGYYDTEDDAVTTWTVVGTSGVDDTITVKNESDRDVDINFSYDKVSDIVKAGNITAKFNGLNSTSFQLGSDATLSTEPKQKSMGVVMEGYPRSIEAAADFSNVVIGEVTVQITGK